ncbi:hypothetical protein EHF33_20390 (plasmid) [Deinococcus psychrotolerans]|uniref:Uncharacterized protein n=1 Tax=Deinococcus psychrotolerans TaxID=2489213 RepID=A0A3G8YLX7_9DEIO|nr:hypothetical protein [Deinococcus psychrotolerans]AZI45267.1 hypothetical protein EHF33_20390 [Deinococcus psychrotolerans]
MTHKTDFAAATMLHLVSSSEFQVLVPQHPGLECLSRALRRLYYILKDTENDPEAERLRATLYRARLNAVSGTLPLSHPLIWNSDTEGEVRDLTESLAIALPAVSEHVTEALRVLKLLQLFDVNPMAKALQEDIDRRRVQPKPPVWPGFLNVPERWALVVRPALVDAMRSQWREEEEVAVITPKEMTGDQIFEHVYLFGAARRYPAALLSCPHSPSVTLYRYAFTFDEDIRLPLVEVLRAQSPTSVKTQQLPFLLDIEKVRWQEGPVKPHQSDTLSESVAALDEPQEDQYVVWQDEGVPETQTSANSSVSSVKQQLVREVSIQTQNGPRTIRLDELEATPCLNVSYPPSVEAVTGATVKVNDVLLLRTEGTQLAYSRDLARAQFGPEYLQASQLLQDFKMQLRQSVNAAGGRKRAVKLMVRAGADRSCTVANLSSWYTMTIFRPDSETTYAALLSFTGWTDRRNSLDRAIQLLRSLHIHAGQQAGEQRLQLLLKLDFLALEEHGYLEAKLGGGSIHAHRVLHVAVSPWPTPFGNELGNIPQ